MNQIGSQILFYTLGALMIVFSVLAVTSKRMLRAATYLLFVLIGTAGIYLLLNYHFLAAIQLAVYAGGILILFIFAILLTRVDENPIESHRKKRVVAAGVAALAGGVITIAAILKQKMLIPADNISIVGDQEINMQLIGKALMGTYKHQFLLPFEAISVLLLVCAIGGILIARKR